MIKIVLANQKDQPIEGKVDHEKEVGEFISEGEEMAVLAIKDYEYQLGDKIIVEIPDEENYFVVQLDETMAPSLIFIPGEKWEYHIPLKKSVRTASVDTAFLSKRHHLFVRKAYPFEITNYQNLSLNPHDQKHFSGAYPHSMANVETRDEAVFFSKNAIDGKYGNTSHGSYPFGSWGINQQLDAELTLDFGREILTDKIQLMFRGDYPHDSFWKEVTLAFSDGTEMICSTTNSMNFQKIIFQEKRTTTVVLKNMKKNNDESPFPALTQIDVFGRNLG